MMFCSRELEKEMYNRGNRFELISFFSNIMRFAFVLLLLFSIALSRDYYAM